MADPVTSYMGLSKPSVGDPNGSGSWGSKLDANMDIIDQYVSKGTIDGCCRFIFASANLCQLIPRNGSMLWINGKPRVVPSLPGVQASNTGLSPQTLYYAYAYMTTDTVPVMAIEFSQVVYADDGSGHACKTGDNTRRCVGMVWTDINGQFQDNSDMSAPWVFSYFHRRRRTLYRDFDVVSGSPNLVPLIGDIRFISWGDEETTLEVAGGVLTNTAGAITNTQIVYDGTGVGRPQVNNYGSGVGRGSCATKYATRGTVGVHRMSIQGSSSAGSAEWKMQAIVETTG